MASHSEGALIKEFCTQRKASCDKHGEKYREVNCVVAWPYQAHHVLCVASVTQYISADTDITKIVEQTPWCVNRKPNMLAMPTYMGPVFKMFAEWSVLTSNTGKPPYADIPVHGYDHNSKSGYKSEIDAKMRELAANAKKNIDKHEEAATTLQADLDAYRDLMNPKLKKRGERGAGTYNEWLKVYSGEKGPDSNWYVPFSMADRGSIDPRTYPTGRVKAVFERVKEIVKALI